VSKLLISPHNDDETLWAAFTIQREKPEVLVVFDSYVQPSRGVGGCTFVARRRESVAAVTILGSTVTFAGFRDDRDYPLPELANELRRHYSSPSEVWAPAYEPGGHDQHNLVAQAAELAYPGVQIHSYLTYTRTNGKSTSGIEVPPGSGEAIARKLRALACYRSQLQLDPRLGCWPHFLRDQREYIQA
jgi:LmbE family N-acetylglucosaminyl deacetylase